MGADEDIKVLFLPDQHLGRNVASDFGYVTEHDVRDGQATGSRESRSMAVAPDGRELLGPNLSTCPRGNHRRPSMNEAT